MPSNCPHLRKEVVQIDPELEETTYKCLDCLTQVTPLGPRGLRMLEERQKREASIWFRLVHGF